MDTDFMDFSAQQNIRVNPCLIRVNPCPINLIQI